MLVMNGQISESDKVFGEAKGRVFRHEELAQIHFRPVDAEEMPLRLKGTVAGVRPGYAFIASPGMPDFFVPASKLGSLVLRPSQRVEFSPGFTVRGPIAVDLKADE